MTNYRVLALLVCLCLGCAGCLHRGPRPDALCTTSIVADLVTAVAGPDLRVERLMGPGVDPHIFAPTQRTIVKMARARVIVYHGLHLEGQMGKVLDGLAEARPVFAVTDALPRERLLPAGEHAYDPHVWFDVSLWALTPEWLAERLGQYFLQHRETMLERARAYRRELEELDTWVARQVEQIPPRQRVLITAHDAFRYFGHRYGIEVVGLQGISTSSEAGLADMHRLVELIVTRRVKAIFVESSVPRRAIEALQLACAARGHRVEIGGTLYSDALGPPGSGADTYVGMVRHNVRTIVEALR